MKISKHFTAKLQTPFDGISFTPRTCEIREAGALVFKQEGLLFPDFWSQAACDIAAQKYFRKAGGDFAGEKDLRQVIHRIVGCWKHWGERLGYFSSPQDAQAFYDEQSYLIVHQMASPNSPQWFNTGLHWAYGIASEAQGHFYVDEKTGKTELSTTAYERPQVHACFIQSISDDLVKPLGIMDLWVREARVFKFGSGTGSNFSRLRGVGESLDGGGVTSGLMAFLKVGDVAAGSVRSGGVTRRAAKMICLDLDHPEIESFIRWKCVEELKVAELISGSTTLRPLLSRIWEKSKAGELTSEEWEKSLRSLRALGVPENVAEQARDLGKQGLPYFAPPFYDSDWRGEGYRAVFGQNANTSVRVPSDFLKKVSEGKNWQLTARKDGRTVREVSAATLWKDVARAAWMSADPGVQFDTLISEWHTCPESGEIRASNPCSEYLFLDDTGCNLASLNLLKFWNADRNEIDVAGYSHACRLWTLTLDISVSMAQYPSKEIAERSVQFRTLGLGYANLGALLLSMGRPYDSGEARAIASALTSLMAATAWSTSTEIAAELGAFQKYELNKKHIQRVIKNHARAAGALDTAYEGLSTKPFQEKGATPPKALQQAAIASWNEALKRMEKTGVRNAQVTAIAPTGTIGLVMDCDTTGIEPEFALRKHRRLAGGGTLDFTNRAVSLAFKTLGYSSQQIESLSAHFEKQMTFAGAKELKPEHLAVFDCAQASGPDQRRISIDGHLKMLAVVQPFISGGISKTVSLPQSATVEHVQQVFEKAHEWMIKCVAIYRDGSKLSQPLAAGMLSSSPSALGQSPEACFECG